MEREESRLGGIGRKAVAWLILAAAVVLGLWLLSSIVLGFLKTVVTLAVVVAIGVAIVWALRRL